MAPLCETLFNKPTFANIKIRQIHDGKVREYFGHKAVLCGHFEWFLKALPGPFKEATEPVIEIHEDDPEHFEVMLKYLYTNKYESPE